MTDAAAAGRLVVALLFAANAVAYLVTHSAVAAVGMAFAIMSATAGYFAASREHFGLDGQGLLSISIGASVASGSLFVWGVL